MLSDTSIEPVTTPAEKVVPFHLASGVFAELRAGGKRIVQCHGTFDLIHPGHIYHLEEASALGDVLVVTLTGEKYVNKGPGRPYFNDQLRAKSLAALACVDFIVIVPFPAAVEAIECVRPDVYCKGREYEEASSDVTGNIHEDVACVERLGGEVRYIGSVVFSSTRLLNNLFDHQAEPVRTFTRTLAERFSPTEFRGAVDGFTGLRVLVLGDTIIDRYSYLTVQGLASKNRIISGRFLREDSQCGGALAVLRHLREFTPHVRFISLVGTEPWVEAVLRAQVPEAIDMAIRDPEFTTIVKQRFVEPLGDGKELSKLFSVNFVDADPPSAAALDRLMTRIDGAVDDVDAVFLLDFGHGMMQAAVRDLVQDRAPFLALNCQTNSNNHGFNIITRQYRRADAFSLDAQELQLACGHRHIDYARELELVREHLNARTGWLTRGEIETIGLRRGEPACLCPPLENDIVDTVGAGDAFFTLASLSAVADLPVDLGTFLGQLAGAQAVRIVGNSSSISKAKLLKSGMSLINY